MVQKKNKISFSKKRTKNKKTSLIVFFKSPDNPKKKRNPIPSLTYSWNRLAIRCAKDKLNLSKIIVKTFCAQLLDWFGCPTFSYLKNFHTCLGSTCIHQNYSKLSEVDWKLKFFKINFGIFFNWFYLSFF